jgi:subtilisin-like proprotein convertase family protein
VNAPLFPALILSLLAHLPLTAATVVITNPVDSTVPDNNPIGLVSMIPVSSNEKVAAVEVLLEISGGWNGDLYAYLEHQGVISVLLNRPGKTAINPSGAASSGMFVHFADGAASDIHTAISDTPGAFVSGMFQPDGRAADPDEVTDTSPRTLFLSGFQGLDTDGEWNLFIADLGTGDESRLVSWTLSVTTVPEPSSAVLTACGLASLLFVRRRERRQTSR